MPSKIFTGNDLPLTTGNAALAFCLYIAGIPFQDEKQPLANVYDVAMLQKLGYKNTPVEQAVQMAFAAGHKGHVEYGFKRALRIGEALEGFKNHQRLADESNALGAALVGRVIKEHVLGLLSLPEALSGAACITLKRWREELKHWEQNRKYSARHHKNSAPHKVDDVRELAEKMFLAGEPFAFMAVIMDARPLFLQLHLRFPPVIRLRRVGSVTMEPYGKGKLAKHPGFAFFTPETDNTVRKDLRVPLK